MKWFVLPTKVIIITVIFFINIYAKDSFVLNAESVVYDGENKKLIAKTDVILKYKDTIIKTQEAIYDTERELVYTTTDTVIYRDKNIINLSNMVYDITTGSITAENFSSFFDPYYFYAGSCVIKKDKYILINTKVTHCDEPNPHYYFEGKKVVVYPKNKIEIYTPKIKIFGIPILWLPYYEISLKHRRDCMIIEPGYDSYNGSYAKIRYIYSLSQSNSVHLLLDLFQYQGVGTGLEYRYYSTKQSGLFYAYYIKQRSDNKIRWNLLFNDSHKISNMWTMQTSLEFLSDQDVYYYYNKENWYLLRNEINSSISFIRNANRTTLRTTYLRKDEYDSLTEKFVNKYYQIPVNFIYYPSNIGKLTIMETFSFIPTFIESTNYYNIYVANQISAFYPLRISIFALTPNLYLTTNFIKPDQYKDFYYYNVYTFVFPLRYRIRSFGIADISYNYGIKSLNNSFLLDESSDGVTKNSIVPRIDLFYRRKYLRTYFEYNFLVRTGDWTDNITPIKTDLGTDFGNVDINLHTRFNVKNNVVENSQVSLGYKFNLRNRFGITYVNDINNPETHIIHTSVDFALKNLWQFRIQTVGNYVKYYDIINSTYEIYRNLHCWETKIAYSDRKNVQEIWFYIGFRFKSSSEERLDHLDRQYMPWRNK